MIEVEQPAEPLVSLDPTVRVRRARRAFDQRVLEPLMVPFDQVVLLNSDSDRRRLCHLAIPQ